MNVISASYGNDSVAMIQWAHETALPNVTVAYCDTGWAAPWWAQRVAAGESLARGYGFAVTQIKSIGMEALVKMKKGFPSNQHQFCTAHLKGLPFLHWIDEADPGCKAIVFIGKRRAESVKRRTTPAFIEASEYHGGRRVEHPLYLHTHEERNALVARSGLELLPHRSDECFPCVNANRPDLVRLTDGAIERVNDLEVEGSQPMFRAKRFGALGIHGVVVWAKRGRDRGDIDAEESECASLFGCESATTAVPGQSQENASGQITHAFGNPADVPLPAPGELLGSATERAGKT